MALVCEQSLRLTLFYAGADSGQKRKKKELKRSLEVLSGREREQKKEREST